MFFDILAGIIMNSFVKKIEKVVVNIGLGKMHGEGHFEDKILPEISKELGLITGQKPSSRPARMSIAGFKVREGEAIGLKVTLRRKKMADFLARLINAVLPRVKDFRGLDPKIIDKGGNMNIGLRDKMVFPEIDPNESRLNFGLQITIVPKAVNSKKENMLEFYKTLGFPLK